jgi:hypothetical protein
LNIALFTPTHDPKYLHETYFSLCKSKIAPFKVTWFIGYNGKATPDQLPDEGRHETVSSDNFFEVVHVSLENVGVIGALKRALCVRAISDGADVVVELDHDDLLAPDAIAEIGDAFSANPAVGFVYSDFTEFVDNGATWASYFYNGTHGWASCPSPALDYEPRSVGLIAMQAFEPSARSMSEIYFAPNHVRAWRSTVYTSVGGHDVTMDVCDDHDLVIRTYLATQMHRIAKPIYYYRRHADGGNSFLAKAEKIANLSLKLRDRYLHRLVERECALKGYAMLDLGGSTAKPSGWLSVDLADADIVHDLTSGLPDAPDGRPIGAVRAFDFLEHLSGRDATKLIQSIYDKLVPGGWLLTRTPHSSGLGADCDPTHISRWNELSFLYHTDAPKRQYLKNQMPWLNCRYQRARLHVEHYDVSCNNVRVPPIPYVVADLCALKGQQQPGVVFI